METVKVVLIGAGDMGRRIIEMIGGTNGIELAGVVEKEAYPIAPGTERFFVSSLSDPVVEKIFQRADVVIDVSGQEAFMANAALVVGLEKPMVIGSTGLNEQDMSYLRRVSGCVPCVLAPDFSLGVPVGSRDPHALGAVLAALWVAEQAPGLYGMQNVLGLK